MKTKTTKTRKTKKTTKKSGIIESVIKRGQIYCVNHKKNKTPYWGGEICDTHVDHDGNIIRWVCSTCVAKLAPAPVQRNTPKIDPLTGEKRKRGRPKGSKNTVTTTKKKTTRKGKK
jgi:hypothetical protein